MLQTWFNDDGSVPNYGVIAIKQKPKHLIEFIQTTLMEFNIKSIVSRDGDTWLLRICSYLDLKKFQEKINFTKGYRKRELLEKTISEKKNPTNVTKNKILELLQNSPRTLKELQYNLSINRNVIYGHLHGWKRKSKNKKSTLGLVDLNLIGVKGKGKDKIFYIK